MTGSMTNVKKQKVQEIRLGTSSGKEGMKTQKGRTRF